MENKRIGYSEAKSLMRQLANNHPGTKYVAFLDPEFRGYGFYIVCDALTHAKLYKSVPVTYAGQTGMDGSYYMKQLQS